MTSARGWLLLIGCSVGCGRFGFDANPRGSGADDAGDAGDDDAATIPDAPECMALVHDEDNDGVDDACDVCPHLAGPQVDTDGDRVGDACDPEPTMARQQIVLFDPFVTLDSTWQRVEGSEAVMNDELVMSAVGDFRRVRRPITLGHDLFAIGGTSGMAGSNEFVFAIRTTPASPPGSFYCEIYDNTVRSSLNFTYTFDDQDFPTDGTSNLATRFANGSGTFSYEVTATTARCKSTWHSDPREVLGNRPAGIVADHLDLFAQNIDMRIAYFVQIRTND